MDSIGRGGGLALLWSNEIQLDVVSFSQFHINAKVRDDRNDNAWRFRGFYDHPKTQRKSETWSLLRRLNEQFSLLCLCTEDFNEILVEDEKYGGAIRFARQIAEFREVVKDCVLYDMQYNGPKYTWLRRYGSNMAAEILDSGLTNDAFHARFDYSYEKHLTSPSLDHAPLLFHISSQFVMERRGRKMFRFENMWTRHPDCASIIKKGWEERSSSELMDLTVGIERCGRVLSKWNMETLGNLTSCIRRK